MAELIWYEVPGSRDYHDAFWKILAARLKARNIPAVPLHLSRQFSMKSLLGSENLLFGQVCGYSIINELRDQTQLIGTPIYSAKGCVGPNYRSYILKGAHIEGERLDDFRGTVCAVNELNSHSGRNALEAMVAPLSKEGKFFSRIALSGSHQESLSLIQNGIADIAAIDCIVYSLIQQNSPHLLNRTKIIAQTPLAPAPPWITSKNVDQETLNAMREVIQSIIRSPGYRPLLDRLQIRGFQTLPQASYEQIRKFELHSDSFGYQQLRNAIGKRSTSHPTCQQTENLPLF